MLLKSIFAVFLVFSNVASAQELPGLITVNGIGQVAVAPDMATISLGVEVEAPTADRALRSNSARMGEIFDVLKDRGIADRDIQTNQLSLHPQWKNQKSSFDDPLVITGFLATNMVSVKIRNLDLLGPVLDTLTKSGANRIQSIEFGIQNPKPHLDAARKLAVADAIEKATLYTKAAGLALGNILLISEAGANTGPRPQFAVAALSREAMPVAEGELTLSATITVQFQIAKP